MFRSEHLATGLWCSSRNDFALMFQPELRSNVPTGTIALMFRLEHFGGYGCAGFGLLANLCYIPLLPCELRIISYINHGIGYF
jgi:hypothetical protein